MDFAALWPILAGILALVALTALAQWLMGLCNNRLTYCTVRDIRHDAFAHIQRLPCPIWTGSPRATWSAASSRMWTSSPTAC